ncbi:glycosyltransferase [Pedobacter jamesrossensis]
MDKPLVSIALCTFNGEKYISEQLESILNQDYPNLEIIVVDDNSTDKTIDILKSFAEKNQNISLILNETNIGFNNNFNKALMLCSAEYIAIADQDDIWLPKKISCLVNNINDNLLIYHDSEYIDDRGFSLNLKTSTHHRFVSGNCTKQLLYYNCISGHACLMRKELLDLTPEFNKNLYYDWWLAYTASCTGRLDFIKDKLVKHRKHIESSTGNDKTDAKLLRVTHLNLFLNHPLTPKPIAQLISKLLSGYSELTNKSFSKKLFSLLISNRIDLLFIRKKSFYSQIKFLIKESSK